MDNQWLSFARFIVIADVDFFEIRKLYEIQYVCSRLGGGIGPHRPPGGKRICTGTETSVYTSMKRG